MDKRNIKGHVKDAKIKPVSLASYKRNYMRFVSWVHARYEQEEFTIAELEILMILYVEYVEDNHLYPTWVKALKSAVVHYHPNVRDQMLEYDRTVQGFYKLHPSISWVPLSPKLVWGITALNYGLGRVDTAVALLLSFDCYLRISEVCQLMLVDVDLPNSDHGYATVASITIRDAKTGEDQYILLRDPFVVRIFGDYVRDLPSEQRLVFPRLSVYRLRCEFHDGLDMLGIPRGVYVYHSIRHGAAASDYHSGRHSRKEIMVIGRWTSSKTMMIYIQKGRRLMVNNRLPSGDLSLLAVLVDSNHMVLWGYPIGPLRFYGLSVNISECL